MILWLFIYYSCIPIYIMMNILTLLSLLCIMVSVLLGYKHLGRGTLFAGRLEGGDGDIHSYYLIFYVVE